MQSISMMIEDPSHASAARHAAQRMAHQLEFDETRTGRAAIAVTEAVTNMVRHGGGGTLVMRALEQGKTVGFEVLAIDSGPGMADLAASSRDGTSTAGTAGTGLGAMRRQSDGIDIYTEPGKGTIVRMLFWRGPVERVPGDYEVGVVLIPKPGETECGDAWAMVPHARGATFLVADGLGHGPDAAIASGSAVDVLHRNSEHSAVRVLDIAHARLRPTRGAAVAVMRHDAVAGDLAFAGVGNIAACVIHGESRRAMVSHNGIVGHNAHKLEEYRYSWPAGALLIAHSDGLETRWDINAFPGLAHRHPALVAAMLYREHSRKRDDVAVMVIRTGTQ